MKKFDPRSYPIVTRVVNGYIEVSQPDLGIYRYKKRFDDLKKAEEIGSMVLDVMKEAVYEYSKAHNDDTSLPFPSRPKGALRNPLQNPDNPHLSIRQVAELLALSEATIRRMCESGKLTAHLTPGGHRRFSRAEVENILSQKEKPSPGKDLTRSE